MMDILITLFVALGGVTAWLKIEPWIKRRIKRYLDRKASQTKEVFINPE